MHLSSLGRNLPCPPGGDSSAVAGHDGVRGEAFTKLISDHLGTHRLVLHRALLLHHLVPFAHAPLRLLQEAAIRLTFEELVHFSQRTRTVTYESHVDGIAQANSLRVEIDLDGFCFSRFGIKLNVRE